MLTPLSRRSIPACAGETIAQRLVHRAPLVYPRVCGGNIFPGSGENPPEGLSPRVRGKQLQLQRRRGWGGSIPACAGETIRPQPTIRGDGVYPRVCGGNVGAGLLGQGTKGLSPRVRGKLPALPRYSTDQGSIPACAGETLYRLGRRSDRRVYPRVCGGNLPLSHGAGIPVGLSPRVRGKLVVILEEEDLVGSIPACAGETPLALRARWQAAVYPRVCGGNSNCCGNANDTGGLSPRVRGKPVDPSVETLFDGSIPACAGETAPPSPHNGWGEVYPRVCGGNAGMLTRSP